jgi:hypothetical protein
LQHFFTGEILKKYNIKNFLNLLIVVLMLVLIVEQLISSDFFIISMETQKNCDVWTVERIYLEILSLRSFLN